MNWKRHLRWAALLALGAQSIAAKAEDGSAAWLRYAPLTHPEQYRAIPSTIVVEHPSTLGASAAEELRRGLSSMLGRPFTVQTGKARGPAIMLPDQGAAGAQEDAKTPGGQDAFLITREKRRGGETLVLAGAPRAQLYAAFHLLEEVGAEKTIPDRDVQTPAAPIRWTDEWDNPNGSIERGYAGASFFFADGHVRPDLTRAGQYARLLASVGINGCNINNVNADPQLLTSEHIREIARIAGAFRPWDVRLALSVNFTSAQSVGGLNTSDPLDPQVIAWWKSKADEIYALIPDLAGFTVKADSEGQPGPAQYGRTPAEAANMLAGALAPHGGVVLYRAFVYNHHLDWHDLKADRARAGYDIFAGLDGTFAPNVVVQIKHGPIDFQTREPVSPLLAALRHTNEAIELQTSQEYTGQQRHMMWLPAMWKWVLDTDMRAGGQATPVKEIVAVQSFHRPLGGFVSVVNAGLDANWLHHPMAAANLYGYGRLAWNPNAQLDEMADAWTRLTWGDDPEVVRTVKSMLLSSWSVYEGYTGPNGMGTLTDILGPHFGPGIESAEHNGWGQWFRAEQDGIGMDRTAATGTGYIGQYPPEFAAQYETLARCPDDLLLFFHHVPYSQRLHSGKTLAQSIYDGHYAAAAAVAGYVDQWERLRGRVDAERFQQVDQLLTFQAGHAIVWRDAVNTWFQRASGIADAQSRVGRDPDRVEAEGMQAEGYTPVEVSPAETASGGKAVICAKASGCALRTTLRRPAGRYDIAVAYFDLRTGASRYSLLINGKEAAHWSADDALPPLAVRARLDGQTSTRFTVRDIALQPGDMLELRAVPDFSGASAGGPTDRASAASPAGGATLKGEPAPVDYIEVSARGSARTR